MKDYQVRVVRITGGSYCLTINVEETHVTLSSCGYTPQVDISIFGNTPDDIVGLARAILDAHARVIHEGG